MQTTKKRATKGAPLQADFGAQSRAGRGLQAPHSPGSGGRDLLEMASRFLGAFMAGVAVVAVCLVSGCSPPGPRAVLEGKRLLERGEVPQAIEELKFATQLMPTNALAFNYLGLACHQAGQATEAERAYLRALAVNHDLTEVHYDLGCLWLAQPGKLEQAKAELTTYTLRRPNAPEGWLKLGEVQLRTRELAAAEKSLAEALRLDPKNPEILTGLGLLRHERRRAGEAAQFFSQALKEQPDYRPALLNLAIVAQQELNDPHLALQKYREYVSLKPTPENAQAVGVLIRQLEQGLNPVAHEPPPTNAPLVVVHTNAAKPAVPDLAHALAGQKAAPTNLNHTAAAARTDSVTNAAKTGATTPPKPAPITNPPPPEHVEVVNVGADPEIKPAQDLNGPTSTTAAADTRAQDLNSSGTLPPADAKPPKRSFFQRINPINLFTRDGKPSTDSAPLLASTATRQTDQATVSLPVPGTPVAQPEPQKFPRYTYRSPEKPLPGDRDLAQRAFSQGVQDQRARRFPEAIQDYRRAAQLDPSYYDAHYNLGLAASQNGSLALALAAYETALAIEPDSLDARYNFGLVLKQSGYVLDAVAEFDRILAKYPNDARTHLALGNVYAQQLADPAKAREQYLVVLTVAPQSPQASAIRYWLNDHPK